MAAAGLMIAISNDPDFFARIQIQRAFWMARLTKTLTLGDFLDIAANEYAQVITSEHINQALLYSPPPDNRARYNSDVKAQPTTNIRLDDKLKAFIDAIKARLQPQRPRSLTRTQIVHTLLWMASVQNPIESPLNSKTIKGALG